MYTREIQPPITSPIKDGKPLIGTWTKAFDKVDLLEIRKPYPLPLPRWVRNFRIKEWQCFTVQNDDILLEASFFNFKLYRLAQVLIYDKQSGEKHFYRKYKFCNGWSLPQSLANSYIEDSHPSNFYFRIYNCLNADIVRLDIDITQAHRKPSLAVHLAFNVSSQHITPMAVSLGIADRGSICRRSMYAYKAFTPVRGDIVLGGHHISLKQETSAGFFCDYKGFFPYRMQTAVCSAIGLAQNNKRFGFHIAENQNRDPNKNNENALWVEGELTPLPPVLITMPTGPDGIWVIQDVEGMIDLTFNAPTGYYNGMLVTKEGEQIQIKNLFGIGEKLVLRV